jgi:hypothetical protein
MRNTAYKRVLALGLGILVFLTGCANPTGTGVTRGAADPNAVIPISSAVELQMIGAPGYPLDGEYIVTADFSLPNDWKPVAPDAGSAFSGEFNGNGKTITVTGFDPLYAGSYLGIFGYIRGKSWPALISDLNISLSNVSAPQNASSYIGGLAGYVENATLTGVSVSGALSYTAADVVYAGGVGGYLRGTIITGTQAGLGLSVTSAAASAYGGQLAGYGDGIYILKSNVSGGSVSVTGKGHNTSGGGLAGYVTNKSIVNSCSTNCAVSVKAIGTGSTPSALYMSYAGGLLGYQGNESAVSQSHAFGAVTAESPYPYAGGLVGYNYGALGGAGGSSITQCYARGNVTANALTSSVGGLPYAGGLAGYNSSSGSVIEDCYAEGDVAARTSIKYAWAGGIVGANANNAAVNRTYATGEVSIVAGAGALPSPQPQVDEGALAGGIAGYNYFTDTTAITASFGLNTKVQAAASGSIILAAYRVVGRNGYSGGPAPVLKANSGNEDMILVPAHTVTPSPTGLDGADCAEQPAQTDYEAAGWDFTYVWYYNSVTGYPTLR